jgi:hypothetical protein
LFFCLFPFCFCLSQHISPSPFPLSCLLLFFPLLYLCYLSSLLSPHRLLLPVYSKLLYCHVGPFSVLVLYCTICR